MPRPRQLHDRYFRQAKAEGYLARSAFKLIEIDERFDVLRGARRVIDLGCVPGSWLQVVAERAGPGVQALGVDLAAVEHAMPGNVRTVVADVTELDPANLPVELPFDVVLSDMAPNTVGRGDDLRSAALCRVVLGLLADLLAPGGRLVMKNLEGAETAALLKETAAVFNEAKLFKPRASREISREMFIVARGYRGGR